MPETVTVNKKKISKLQKHAEHANGKLQKTLEWRIPTDRSEKAASLLQLAISQNEPDSSGHIDVSKDLLKDVEEHVDYANGKLQKTYDWPDPTQRLGHIKTQLRIILGEETGELEDYEFDSPL